MLFCHRALCNNRTVVSMSNSSVGSCSFVWNSVQLKIRHRQSLSWLIFAPQFLRRLFSRHRNCCGKKENLSHKGLSKPFQKIGIIKFKWRWRAFELNERKKLQVAWLNKSYSRLMISRSSQSLSKILRFALKHQASNIWWIKQQANSHYTQPFMFLMCIENILCAFIRCACATSLLRAPTFHIRMEEK